MKKMVKNGYQYLYDESGNKVGSFVAIDTFEKILDHLEDYHDIQAADKVFERFPKDGLFENMLE